MAIATQVIGSNNVYVCGRHGRCSDVNISCSLRNSQLSRVNGIMYEYIISCIASSF